jgi:hypothetical protein
MITAATMAQTPSALMIKPKKLISSLSDMRSSPLKEHESFRRTIYLRADFGEPSTRNLPTSSLGREYGADARD